MHKSLLESLPQPATEEREVCKIAIFTVYIYSKTVCITISILDSIADPDVASPTAESRTLPRAAALTQAKTLQPENNAGIKE